MVQWLTFAILLPWAALWIQVAVLPFYGKREKLHQDYIASGQLDAALAFIDANQVVGVLAEVFGAALDLQDDRRRRVNVQELLARVDFLPSLERLEAAIGSKRKLQQTYDDLRRCASRTWQFAISHVLLVLVTPLPIVGLYEPWTLSFVLACGMASVIALAATVIHLIWFDKLMTRFINLLQIHRD